MKRHALVGLISMVILVSGCRLFEKPKFEYLIFGRYAGECSGHCATMYKLQGSMLYVDTTDSFFNNGLGDPKNMALLDTRVTFKGDTLSGDMIGGSELIQEMVPALLYELPTGSFGHPDEADRGGIFVEFKYRKIIKRFYIDTDRQQLPEDLWDFVRLITLILNTRS